MNSSGKRKKNCIGNVVKWRIGSVESGYRIHKESTFFCIPIIVYNMSIRSHIRCHIVHINYLIIDRTVRLDTDGKTKRAIIYR